MNIYMSQTQIEYGVNGDPQDLLVRLQGNDGSGQSLDNTVILTADDFPKGTDLTNFSLDQAKDLAIKKITSYLK